MAKAPEWMRQDEVLGYIVNSYAGVEPAPTNPAIMRRVFLWEDPETDEVKMGNAEAFIIHLGRHFGNKTRPRDASQLHSLLRELGEVITPHKKHESPSENSPKAGKFKQPAPEEWTVGRKRKKDTRRAR